MVRCHRQAGWEMRAFSSKTPEALIRIVEDFVAKAPAAVVLDDSVLISFF
jgi:hypothetical protein